MIWAMVDSASSSLVLKEPTVSGGEGDMARVWVHGWGNVASLR